MSVDEMKKKCQFERKNQRIGNCIDATSNICKSNHHYEASKEFG